MFFVFDGIDGAGKSTQLLRFVEWLKRQKFDVVTCKDPGSTKLGEQLRALLLGNHDISISNQTETMMFVTARSQLVDEIVRPALEAGKVVVLDRYILSTLVYQGYAGETNLEDIEVLNRVATKQLKPDLTFLLDVPVEVSLERLGASLDRMESRGPDYLQQVREGFLEEAQKDSTSIRVIDATANVDSIEQTICGYAETFLKQKID